MTGAIRIEMRWSLPARWALWFLLLVFSVGLLVSSQNRLWFRHTPPPDLTAQAGIREAIDPNTASTASIRRLPGISIVRAEAIATYARTHGPNCYRTPDDLQRVHGIGPATVRKILPYLWLDRGGDNATPRR